MHEGDAQDWHYLCTPDDARDRLIMTLLRLLLDKGVISEEELWDQADPERQETVTEDEARRQWHTPWLPTEELAGKVRISPDSIVLDAGSGVGGPARQLAEQFGCRVIGIDRDPLRALHAIRQTEHMALSDRVSFCWGVLSRLPFPDESFDVVWAQESVTGPDTEWDDEVPTGLDRLIFGQFRRVLRPEGRLVCQVHPQPLNDGACWAFSASQAGRSHLTSALGRRRFS